MINAVIRNGLILMLLCSVSGCGEKVTEKDPFEKEGIVIGFSLGTLKEERWQKDRDYFLARAQERGVSVGLFAADGDPQLQMTQAENLIYQGVDVIVIVPEDATRTAQIVEKAHEEGIPVISYDRLILNAPVDYYISFDNDLVGRFQAQGVVSQLGDGKNIAYIGGAPTDNNSLQLKNGAMAVLQPYIERGEIALVLETYTDEWKPEKAYKTLQKYLAVHETVDGVICANDGTALGAIRALEEVGLAGKVPVSGQDAELTACKRIRAGVQTMTVYKPVRQLAEEALDMAIAIAKNEKIVTTGVMHNGAHEVPALLLKPIYVSNENLYDTVIADGFHTEDELYN